MLNNTLNMDTEGKLFELLRSKNRYDNSEDTNATSIINMLKEYPEYINKLIYGHTPLMYAAAADKWTIVEYLVNNGANIKVTNVDGHDAIYFAKTNCHFSIAGYLQKQLNSQLK